MEDGGDGWAWGYLIVALIGTGVQLLFLKLIGMIYRLKNPLEL